MQGLCRFIQDIPGVQNLPYPDDEVFNCDLCSDFCLKEVVTLWFHWHLFLLCNWHIYPICIWLQMKQFLLGTSYNFGNATLRLSVYGEDVLL
jgi:hypothetical protein